MLASNSSSQILNHNPFSCRYDCWVQEPIWLKRWTIQSMDHWNREPKTDFYIVITYSHWVELPDQYNEVCVAPRAYILNITILYIHTCLKQLRKTSYSRLRGEALPPGTMDTALRCWGPKILSNCVHLCMHMVLLSNTVLWPPPLLPHEGEVYSVAHLALWVLWGGTIAYPIPAGTNLSRWFSDFPFPKVANMWSLQGTQFQLQPLLNFETTGIIGPMCHQSTSQAPPSMCHGMM